MRFKSDEEGDSTGSHASHAWISMGGGRPTPRYCPDRVDYVVVFEEPHDPWNPQSWATSKKLYVSTVSCCATFVASFNSAIYAAGEVNVSQHFGVGRLVGTLGTSVFILGFAFGPLIWAPGSELVGRRWPLCIGMLGSSIFTIGGATSKDIQTLIICRFFAGVFGASPLCVVPAVLSDIFNDIHRGTAIYFYALPVFGGPFLAPFVGEFISTSFLGWRWTLYLPAILGFANFCFLQQVVEETFAPSILARKAVHLRRQTGNWAIHAEQEKVELDMAAIVRKYLTRPLRMLVTEPIVLVVSIYMSFIYGLVYATLKAYPYVFSHVYGMSAGNRSLPFLGLFLGIVLAIILLLCQQRSYSQKLEASNGSVIPEWRLGPAMLGALVFPIGLFWFAWTGFTNTIHWMAPVAAGVFIGFGILCIFVPCFSYLVDAFLPTAASAVAANMVLRSTIAAGFPLFSVQMFENLGVQWAGTLLGCLAVAMMPIPVVLRIYGPRLRKKSNILTESTIA